MEQVVIKKSQLATLRGLRQDIPTIAKNLNITQSEVVEGLKQFDLYNERKSTKTPTEKGYTITWDDDIAQN